MVAPAFPVSRYASEGFARELAEYVLAAVLCYERRLHQFVRAQQRRLWLNPFCSDVDPPPTGAGKYYRPMHELTVAVLGTGQMGTQVGIVFKQLGCKVHGFSRTEKPPNETFDKMFHGGQLSACLQTADYICNLLPSTAETCGMLTADLLATLPRRPVLVNAGRGDVVQESVLVQALREGWLSGAVLDVFEEEPLSKDSPLWSMEQVVITPHVGNLVRIESVCDDFLDNLARLERGESPRHLVDFGVGY